MPKHGAHTLADVPAGMVEIKCPKCGRWGRYKRSTLIQRYGPDKSLPQLLSDISQCPDALNYADPCQAQYADPVWAKRKPHSGGEPQK